jgi:capsular polysaccharide biosynthesis protein
MSDNDKGLIIMWSVISVIISFILGFAIGTPNYQFSENVRAKLQQDAKNNYRTDHEQIRFIIDNYYSEDKK